MKGMALTIVETRRSGGITGGVDTHADAHVAAALDNIGGLLGTEGFPTTPAGYARLLGWLQSFGTVIADAFVVLAAAPVTATAWLLVLATPGTVSRTCGKNATSSSPTPAGGHRSAPASTGSSRSYSSPRSPPASTFAPNG